MFELFFPVLGGGKKNRKSKREYTLNRVHAHSISTPIPTADTLIRVRFYYSNIDLFGFSEESVTHMTKVFKSPSVINLRHSLKKDFFREKKEWNADGPFVEKKHFLPPPPYRP